MESITLAWVHLGASVAVGQMAEAAPLVADLERAIRAEVDGRYEEAKALSAKVYEAIRGRDDVGKPPGRDDHRMHAATRLGNAELHIERYERSVAKAAHRKGNGHHG